MDAVIVSYRSAGTLRGCVAPLAAQPDVRVTVVDNASPDRSLDTLAGLDVGVIRSPHNGGFSYGCNLGAARGEAPYLLFLNPDARIDAEGLAALRAALESDPSAGLVAPRILDEDGTLAWSIRRFPRQRSTFAQALFLHRLWPRAAWTDELVREPAAYERAGTPDWVSGACMLIRRDAFEAVGGFDEDFFLYCEDTDICRRLWDAGQAGALRAGGGGTPRGRRVVRRRRDPGDRRAQPRALRPQAHGTRGRAPAGARRGAGRGHARRGEPPPPGLAARPHGGPAGG